VSHDHPRPGAAHRPAAATSLLNQDRARPADGAADAPGAPHSPGDAPLRGRNDVTPSAIAALTGRVIEQSYGVVGLASRHSRPGLAELLRRDEQYKGVQVSFTNDRIVIDLYVILEYGTRISEVAYQLMSAVKFAVESALEMPVVEVNVNVQGIRVSK
jgi:uncharacterized alkaline shock family protein YloU